MHSLRYGRMHLPQAAFGSVGPVLWRLHRGQAAPTPTPGVCKRPSGAWGECAPEGQSIRDGETTSHNPIPRQVRQQGGVDTPVARLSQSSHPHTQTQTHTPPLGRAMGASLDVFSPTIPAALYHYFIPDLRFIALH